MQTTCPTNIILVSSKTALENILFLFFSVEKWFMLNYSLGGGGGGGDSLFGNVQ